MEGWRKKELKQKVGHYGNHRIQKWDDSRLEQEETSLTQMFLFHIL